MKTIAWTVSARAALRKLPPDVREAIEAKLGHYANTGAGNVIVLQGRPGARLRVGDYRVIFVEKADAIDVLAVGHRREVYD